jgi:hypothetical protein
MQSKWMRSDNVVWEELNGEILLVNPRSGGRWLLNAAASAVWKLCDGTRSAGELAARVVCGAGREARAEIAAFCASAERLGLLQSAAHSTCATDTRLATGTMNFDAAPVFRELGAGHGTRRRPSPGGVSGPV